MKKIIIILSLLLLLIPIVVADQETLGIFKRNECVTLLQSCGTCTFVNFTVTYPNSSIALQNIESTKTGSIFNYSFCDTDKLGDYVVSGVGDLDGRNTAFAYNFEISPSGTKRTNMLPLIIFLSIIGIIFIYVGIIILIKRSEL